MSRLSLATVGLVACLGCSPHPTAARAAPAPPVTPRHLSVTDLLPDPPDLEVALHPPAIARDRVYGPLLRRASTLAAAYAGPRTLGTTALTAVERAEEVDVAMSDAGEAIVLLLGVPGDLDVANVVDEKGHAIWVPAVGDVRESFVEYEAAGGESPASLFVLPERNWIVASGAARGRTREALVESSGSIVFSSKEFSLADLTIRGVALLRRDERLRTGSLAPLGRSLLQASFELTPGAEGVIVGRFEYSDARSAASAELTAHEVIEAFRRKLEQVETESKASPGAATRPQAPPLSWLAAAGIERAGNRVNVRAPIPRAWLEALAQADVASPSSSNLNGKSTPDVPWSLWRRATPAPTLTLPR